MDAHDTALPLTLDNGAFVDRLAAAAERLMTAVEERLRAVDGEGMPCGGAADRERDARTLSNIVRLYEKITALRMTAHDDGAGQPAVDGSDRETRNIDEMRRELTQLFERLAEDAKPEGGHR